MQQIVLDYLVEHWESYWERVSFARDNWDDARWDELILALDQVDAQMGAPDVPAGDDAIR